MVRLAPLLLLLTVGCAATGGDDPAAGDAAREGLARRAAARITAAWVRPVVQTLASDAFEGRDNLTAGGKKARDYLLARLRALGLTPAGSRGYAQPFDRGVNLLARIPGSDPALSAEAVLVGAHYDHLGKKGVRGSQCRRKSRRKGDRICNGAADNAAGVAVVLAVARAVKQAGLRPRRTLLFALWDAEEDGLLGSRHFVSKDPRWPIDKLAAAFSVDNVGTAIIRGLRALFAVGVEYSQGLRERVKAASAAPSVQPARPVSSFFVGSQSGGRSDHLPFREKGVPIIFFGSGSSPEYHTPDDEVPVVDMGVLARTARTVLLVTRAVADARQRPAFVARPRPHLDDARALLAVGRIVLKDPAAAGLKPGSPLVAVVRGWVKRLEGYLASPPATEAAWKAYDSFVRGIVTAVFAALGGR